MNPKPIEMELRDVDPNDCQDSTSISYTEILSMKNLLQINTKI
jgi:hypothetical protein